MKVIGINFAKRMFSCRAAPMRSARTLLLPVLIAGALAACGNDGPDRFAASGDAITAPSPGTPFADYIADSRHKITDALKSVRFKAGKKPFDDYSLQQVVDMRSPFAIAPDATACNQQGKDRDHGAGVGFLLVHGLSDSPYLMRDIAASLHDAFPCATLHALLLPGHGTVPGDLTDVTYQDWQKAVRYGMQSFGDDIGTIIPIGYSMGAALLVRDLAEHPGNAREQAMVLLSPGFSAHSDLAWLTPYVRYVKSFVSKERDHDAAKYESLAMNAAAEFQLLTEPFRNHSLPKFDLPVFMAVSSDDRTVKADVAAHFFCDNVTARPRYLLWYQGEDKNVMGDSAQPLCDDIDETASANPHFRTINHAHTAMTMRPEDPHYGMDSDYARCSHYSEKADIAACETGPDTIYGETNLLKSATPGTLRRGTFNPDFGGMMGKMVVFIKKSLDAHTPKGL